ncbi:MAG: hypothetical protein ABI353_15890 [Isosphaeraceae bacterium]
MSRSILERLDELYNYLEVVLWSVIGLILAYRGLRATGPNRRRALIAAAAFLAFGASDWVEAHTGNRWWHPWWLLLWKAGCLTVFGLLMIEHWRRGRSR